MKRRGVGNACVEEFEDPTINWMDGREDRQKVRILGWNLLDKIDY